MIKIRIVKQTMPDSRIVFEIQRKFLWMWIDAYYFNHTAKIYRIYSTLEEAKKDLCYFDGTKIKEEIVY